MASGQQQGGRAGVQDPADQREESPVSDVAPGAEDRDESREREPETTGYAPARKPARSDGAALRIYKPNQGYYTRVGTAIGAGVLIVAGAVFLFEQLGDLMDAKSSYYFPIRYGVTVAWVVILSAVTYWVTGVNRASVEFFVATEGEMKKVNWSTRQEVVRSTKVVIVTVVLMAILLFVVDVMFMLLFSAIKVLKASPGLTRLFGNE